MSSEPGEFEKAGRIKDLFKRIDSRAVTLEFLGGYRGPGVYDKSWGDGPEFSSYPTYRTSDGWLVCLFDDAGSFDYVEWVESPEGERTEYQVREHNAAEAVVMGYDPEHIEDWGYPKCEPMTAEERERLKAKYGDSLVPVVADIVFRESPMLKYLKGKSRR